MISSAMLDRISNKVTSYIDRHVKIAGSDHSEEMKSLFDSIDRLFPNLVVMTCPVMHPGFHHISKNCRKILGLEPGGPMNATITTFFRYVHPTDQDDLHNCFNYLHEYLADVDPDLHHEYRAVLHYRFRKSNGQVAYLHDEKAVVKLGDSGNLYFALIRDLNNERKFEGVKLEIFRQEECLEKILEYRPVNERAKLTKRENDLVKLIRQGLSTKEIAWYLKISHHTVRNTKSKLFEKYQVNNTIELLNMTGYLS